MSGAGFLRGTTSPANTSNRAARPGPTACSSTARTDSSADVDATASRQPAARDEVGLQQRPQPLLAAADPEQPAVLLLRPAHRQVELLEGGVEGGEVAVPLGVGEHAVAVEEQARAHRTALATPRACPAAPNCSTSGTIAASTAAATSRN